MFYVFNLNFFYKDLIVYNLLRIAAYQQVKHDQM